LLLGRFVHDWDIASDARPNDIMSLFRKVIPTGLQHGTVTVVLNAQRYEVTTLRGDGAYTDGRHPDQIRFVDHLEEDLARRDFTINAIAYDPIDRLLTDPSGGCADLQHRVIRAVGVANDRFFEDGLRILRAARFAATLHFDIEPDTARAMKECASRLCCISQERIRDEWLKTLGAEQPSRGLRIMLSTGIIEATLPELLPMIGCTQNRYHAFDVWEHTLQTLDACRAEPILRLAMLLHDIGKPEIRGINEKTGDYTFYHHEVSGARIAEAIVQRLRLSNEQQRRVVHLVRHHLIPYDPSCTDSAVRRWLRRVGTEHLQDILEMARADARGKGVDASETLETLEHLRQRVEELLRQSAALSVRDLSINGHVLMGELGLPPGRQIGQILEHLLQLVIDDPSRNERHLLLAEARTYLQSQPN
jgi:tRNA nucleotidyltransferase (CCA-adding enzyme)